MRKTTDDAIVVANISTMLARDLRHKKKHIIRALNTGMTTTHTRELSFMSRQYGVPFIKAIQVVEKIMASLFCDAETAQTYAEEILSTVSDTTLGVPTCTNLLIKYHGDTLAFRDAVETEENKKARTKQRSRGDWNVERSLTLGRAQRFQDTGNYRVSNDDDDCARGDLLDQLLE